MRILVAEKPSVARDWGRLFGAQRAGAAALKAPGLWITWCVGHLTGLCEPHAYRPAWRAWRAESLPILPARFRRAGRPGTEAHLAAVGQLLGQASVEEVINACDAGREGELIFAGLMEVVGCRKPASRVWLSAMTDAAMRAAFAARRPASATANLLAAARCRSEADWLVGINATRAVTLAHRRGGGRALFSAGRVQTPTLAMLVEREEQVEAFVPETFYRVLAEVELPAREGAGPGRLRMTAAVDAAGGERLAERAAAEALVARLAGGQGRLTEVHARRREDRPPLLFDLTQLQQRAHRRLGLTAQATLDAAQALYERHKAISYPRTDARHIGQAELPEAVAVLGRLPEGPWGAALAAARARLGPGPPPAWLGQRLVDEQAIGDHPAITPTRSPPDLGRLTAAEQGVYALIVRRFIAAFLPAAEVGLTRVRARVQGVELVARGTMVHVPGWHQAEPPEPPLPKTGRLPDALRVGLPATVAAAEVRPGQTEPPPWLGDAGLLGRMERAGAELDCPSLKRAMAGGGLGTPATRAGIIETLIGRGLVERRGRHLHPTAHGRALIAQVRGSALASPELTGRWEARLAEVAEGRVAAPTFMGEVEGLVAHTVRHFLGAQAGLACPRCGRGRLVRGQRAFGCSRWAEGCGWRAPRPAPPGPGGTAARDPAPATALHGRARPR